jgi:septum formation protein
MTVAVHPRLILASASPQRQTLLRQAGYEFGIEPADVDEEDYPPDTLPADVAVYLARLKADKVADRMPDCIVLGADTVVAIGDFIVGKPRDAQHAREMLKLLSGTTHIVITGVSVICRNAGFSQHRRVFSAVRVRPLLAREIEEYVDSGQWQGKAGGYGIQDPDPFVVCMKGCRTNVIGLPMTTVRNLLTQAGLVGGSPP